MILDVFINQPWCYLSLVPPPPSVLTSLLSPQLESPGPLFHFPFHITCILLFLADNTLPALMVPLHFPGFCYLLFSYSMLYANIQ